MMEMPLRLAVVCCFTVVATSVFASFTDPASNTQRPRVNLCAGALNDYLYHRSTVKKIDESKLSRLENRIDTVCQGFRIRIEKQNGKLIGVIE